MPASAITTAQLVARVLRVAGAGAVYGVPMADVDVVPVQSVRVAELMADAHARVHGGFAAVHRGDGIFTVGPSSRGVGGSLSVGSVDDLLGAVEAVHAAGRADQPSVGLTLALEIDPAAPAPDVVPVPPPPADPWVEPEDDLVATLAAAARPVVLAGPGVVRSDSVPGLHALAAAASLGVLNTWGAKGVFDWRSRHHLATGGLQARDFELAGLGDADLIVATGVDAAEAGGDRWRLAPVAEVVPGALGPLAGRWSRPLADIPLPPLRRDLARVTQDGWASPAAPLAPSLVTRHYGQVLGNGGLVAADPGVAGFWVARTYATTQLGAVQVPADRGSDGFAVACALVARLRAPHRPVLAAVDWPLSRGVRDALDAAAALGVAVPVEAWVAGDADEADDAADASGDDGSSDGGRDVVDADDHVARLRSLVHAERPTVVRLATDPRQLDRIVEVAGDIVAWAG
jgi:Thiamine pyrophosphate enzyme, central domain